MPRDWSSYNDALVKEAYFIISKDILDSLKMFDVNVDVNVNVKRKVGRPPYPNSLIILIAVIRSYFKLPYRQTEGLATMLLERLGIKVPDYSTINRRIRNLTVPIDIDEVDESNNNNNIYELAIDSTGYKVTNRGDWIREKWGKSKGKRRRGYIKLHIAVDVRSKKIISLEVTDESIADSKEFKQLIEKASNKGRRIDKVYADTAYDSRDNFNMLNAIGAEAVAIKPRKNSSCKARGSYLRAKTVREFLQDPNAWKDRVRYGLRWIAETCNSTMKRTLGEFVRAIHPLQIMQEMKTKCLTYNLLTAWRTT